MGAVSLVTPWRWARRWKCHRTPMLCGQVDDGLYAPWLYLTVRRADRKVARLSGMPYRKPPPGHYAAMYRRKGSS